MTAPLQHRKLSWRERRDALEAGLCCNGCNKPIHPPSKVVCVDCLEAMGAELRALLARMEERKEHGA